MEYIKLTYNYYHIINTSCNFLIIKSYYLIYNIIKKYKYHYKCNENTVQSARENDRDLFIKIMCKYYVKEISILLLI